MGVREYNKARKEANERYAKKFYRPAILIEKEKEILIREYLEKNEISMNEFFNQAADLLLNQE